MNQPKFKVGDTIMPNAEWFKVTKEPFRTLYGTSVYTIVRVHDEGYHLTKCNPRTNKIEGGFFLATSNSDLFELTPARKLAYAV